MATLPGQRAQFTWALNQYNLAEDADKKAEFARRMAKYIAGAPGNDFTVEQVTQGQLYPAAEVARYLASPDIPDADPGKIAVLFYNALRHGMDYVDPGASSYETRYRARVIDNLHRRAKAFGFVLQPITPIAVS